MKTFESGNNKNDDDCHLIGKISDKRLVAGWCWASIAAIAAAAAAAVVAKKNVR